MNQANRKLAGGLGRRDRDLAATAGDGDRGRLPIALERPLDARAILA